jgi:hypothetical protein
MIMLEREHLRQEEQARLDRLRNSAERNRLGQFATSLPLALDIARYVERHWNDRADAIRFLEPAVGSGAFYSALRQAFRTQTVAEALGIEIDPAVAQVASSLWGETGLDVVEADFTTLKPQPRFNLILTNPPYVRHHHINGPDKERLKALAYQRLDIDVSGLAGLYCHFLLLCDAWLEEGGLAAWLIPSEFMDVNYGKALKDYLTNHVTLIATHRYCPSDVQFCDALVTSAIVVFEKSKPSKSHTASMSFGGSMLAPQTTEDVPVSVLRTSRKWTQFPSSGPWQIPHTDTLGELFTIKRGLATGANSFFILDRAEAQRLEIPQACLKPILPSSRYIEESVIESEADGYPRLDVALSLIDCCLPEDQVQERHPAFWRYLASGKAEKVHTGYLASRRNPWYSQERRDPAPFLCMYMGRKTEDGRPFRFYWNKSQATAANGFLLLYPKGVLKATLGSRPELHAAVLAALEGIKPDSLISEGRVYGGGLYKMEPKELAQLSAEGVLKAIGAKPSMSQGELGLLPLA